MANPMVGCRVQQTCKVPRTSLLATRPAAEETVEAGRNGKDGTPRVVADPGTRTRFGMFVDTWTQQA
jgi:hypothetical protein